MDKEIWILKDLTFGERETSKLFPSFNREENTTSKYEFKNG